MTRQFLKKVEVAKIFPERPGYVRGQGFHVLEEGEERQSFAAYHSEENGDSILVSAAKSMLMLTKDDLKKFLQASLDELDPQTMAESVHHIFIFCTVWPAYVSQAKYESAMVRQLADSMRLCSLERARAASDLVESMLLLMDMNQNRLLADKLETLVDKLGDWIKGEQFIFSSLTGVNFLMVNTVGMSDTLKYQSYNQNDVVVTRYIKDNNMYTDEECTVTENFQRIIMDAIFALQELYDRKKRLLPSQVRAYTLAHFVSVCLAARQLSTFQLPTDLTDGLHCQFISLAFVAAAYRKNLAAFKANDFEYKELMQRMGEELRSIEKKKKEGEEEERPSKPVELPTRMVESVDDGKLKDLEEIKEKIAEIKKLF